MAMKYYSADVGYIPNTTNSADPDLSRMVTTDTGVMLPIIIGDNTQTGDYTFSEFGTMMGLLYGNGYYLSAPINSGYDSQYWDIQALWWPGATLSAPGLMAAYRNGNIPGNSSKCVYIVRGLKRVLVSPYGFGAPTQIWEYFNDALGNRLIGSNFMTANSCIFPYSSGGQFIGWMVSRGSTVNDFRTLSNWSNCWSVTPNTDNPAAKRTVGERSKGITQDVLTALFGDAEEPETPPEPIDEPYGEGGDSEEGGGDGDFTDDTEDIDIPEEPSLSASDTKFITLYNPSKTQLDNLANYMWSAGFDLDTFKKLFADPMDCILGLSIVPVNVPAGSTRTVTIGNISTGISMTVASKQYVTVDCGTLNIKEYWGAYLDYDPYTKAEIYLPYIGTHAIAVDDIMKKSVKVVYRVDILSGACTAFVKCGGSVLYEFIGQCASSIPITGNDWTNVINGALTIAGAVGTMVATGGATAPMAVGTIASACTNSLKPNVEKSGSMSGTGGLMGIQKPYLILTRPRQAKPKNQNKYIGYPSFITSKVEDLSGFTIFESIRLEDIPGTQQELEELKNLLESGVIL